MILHTTYLTVSFKIGRDHFLQTLAVCATRSLQLHLSCHERVLNGLEWPLNVRTP